MARLLLFVDPQAVRHVTDRPQDTATACADRGRGSHVEGATWLLDALSPYLPHLDIVISRPRCALDRRGEPYPRLPPTLEERVIDAIDVCRAPRELSRHEQLLYWLARTFVLRTPSWVALECDRDGWPESSWPYIVECSLDTELADVSQRLHRTLQRFDWSELWWGDDEAPPVARRTLARSLMCLWSVPRTQWPDLLGRSSSEFETRLDVLLTIHAGAVLWPGSGTLATHWVHLPKQALGMRRPLEVMLDEGQTGIARVHDLVWATRPCDR